MNALWTDSFEVICDESILHDATLHTFVSKATDYYRRLIVRHHLDAAERKMVWDRAEPAIPVVRTMMQETDEYGYREAEIALTIRRLNDSVGREIAMGELLQKLLRQRWDQISAVLERGISELEAAESEEGYKKQFTTQSLVSEGN